MCNNDLPLPVVLLQGKYSFISHLLIQFRTVHGVMKGNCCATISLPPLNFLFLTLPPNLFLSCGKRLVYFGDTGLVVWFGVHVWETGESKHLQYMKVKWAGYWWGQSRFKGGL